MYAFCSLFYWKSHSYHIGNSSLNEVTNFYWSNTRWRACKDYITRLQCEIGRNVAYKCWYVENHIFRGALLPGDSIDCAPYLDVLRIGDVFLIAEELHFYKIISRFQIDFPILTLGMNELTGQDVSKPLAKVHG